MRHALGCSSVQRKYRRKTSRMKDLPVRKAPTTDTIETFMPAGTCYFVVILLFGKEITGARDAPF